jgi:hypothetical protein
MFMKVGKLSSATSKGEGNARKGGQPHAKADDAPKPTLRS